MSSISCNPLLLLILTSTVIRLSPIIVGCHPRDNSGRVAQIRVALAGFGAAAPVGIEKSFLSALKQLDTISTIDPAIVESAIAGIRYEGSINMSTDESRRLGAAIGCDFFIVGKAEVVARSLEAARTVQEALVAVMIVDGRTGKLAVFDLVSEEAQTPGSAITAAAGALAGRASLYAERMASFRTNRTSSVSASAETTRNPTPSERIEEMPTEGSAGSAGFKSPEFLNRVTPEYTADAERADISASVEATAVLKSNGEVGDIEITRWAGFGLDQSAERAIRQLKFKPATRDGRPVSVRALIRYNFRRIASSRLANTLTLLDSQTET